MKPTQLLLFVLLVFNFASCDHFCDNPGINPVFIGYDSTAVDTVIYRRFASGTHFETVIDSALLFQPRANNGLGNAIYFIKGDSTLIDMNGAAPDNTIEGIYAGYDWEIFLPGITRTIRISDIETEKYDHYGCVHVASFIQDGTLIARPSYFGHGPETNYTSGYRAYIKK